MGMQFPFCLYDSVVSWVKRGEKYCFLPCVAICGLWYMVYVCVFFVGEKGCNTIQKSYH